MAIMVWSGDDDAVDPAVTGTKFATLARLARWPIEDRPRLVPGAALTTAAWHRVVRHLGMDPTLARARDGDGQAAHELVRAFMTGALPAEVHASISEAVERMGDGGRVALAVRSSAVAEDLEGRTFAGQYLDAPVGHRPGRGGRRVPQLSRLGLAGRGPGVPGLDGIGGG